MSSRYKQLSSGQHRLRGEPKRVWIVIECVFIVIFSVEILLRLKSERKYYFLDAWNWLDVQTLSSKRS